MKDIAIIGLGNPGTKYEKTFHNMGFEVIDRLCEKLGKKIKDKDCQSDVLVFYKDSKKVVIAKPTTYMNLSGDAVKEICNKYIRDSKNIIVIFDDLDIKMGSTKMKISGSGGTHNGMRNIVERLSTKDFPRIKVGIGSDDKEEIIKKVLRRPRKEESELLERAIEKVAEELFKYIEDRDFDKLLRNINNA